MTDRILICLPTRGRPWQAIEAIASVKETASHPEKVDIVVCQDADDPKRFSLGIDGVTMLTERRKRFVEWVNFVVAYWQQDYSHVAWLADDVRYETVGWDSLLRNHPEMIVYGNDLIHGKAMATHPFVRREIPHILGFLVPQTLVHLCADLFLQNLGKELNSIAYDPGILTKHYHWSVGRSDKDQTYEESAHFADRDYQTWLGLVPTVPDLARKVRARL